VRVAVWLDVIVPAVAVKVPVVAPAATVTEAGAVKSPLLLETETEAPPDGAAADRVTVQVDVPPVPRLDSVQPRELRTTGAVRLKFTVFVVLL
jgi:hypothetical protein